jgi:positive regulator of sigma E activity
MLKKVAEAQGPGAASALELLREESRITTVRTRQGLKIGGMVVSAIGIGVLILLRALVTDEPVYLVGLLVFLIGVALFGSSWMVTAPE